MVCNKLTEATSQCSTSLGTLDFLSLRSQSYFLLCSSLTVNGTVYKNPFPAKVFIIQSVSLNLLTNSKSPSCCTFKTVAITRRLLLISPQRLCSYWLLNFYVLTIRQCLLAYFGAVEPAFSVSSRGSRLVISPSKRAFPSPKRYFSGSQSLSIEGVSTYAIHSATLPLLMISNTILRLAYSLTAHFSMRNLKTS